MKQNRRWDPAISYRGVVAETFFRTYLLRPDRSVLLICGAGFDPRSATFAALLESTQVTRSGLFIKEIRDRPNADLAAMADSNEARLRAAIPTHNVAQVSVFDDDGAVVVGRNAAKAVSQINLESYSDVIVDISALSIGSAFPVIKFLVETCSVGGPALHVVAMHNPLLDASVRSLPAEKPELVHGFHGNFGLDSGSRAAKLWLPQLTQGQGYALEKLHAFIRPEETCPILPFPALDPRAGDSLVDEYSERIDSWLVDPRNMVYAAESDPIDLYRTVLDLDDLRSQVFSDIGGSMTVLSPLGSKVTALGALLAALEHNLPVAYLESLGFEFDTRHAEDNSVLTHVWLEGDAYSREGRPALADLGQA